MMMMIKRILLVTFAAFWSSTIVDGFQISTIKRTNSRVVVPHHVTKNTRSKEGIQTTALNLFGKKEKVVAIVEVEEEEEEGWTDFGKDPLTYAYGAGWLSLVSFAFIFAPGELGSPSDAAFLQSIINNPAAPENVNPFFYGIFNLFAIIPIVLGCTISPRASDKGGIPAGPPLFLSTFIAYFIVGPYLALRKSPKEVVADVGDTDWVTKNIWENKILNYFTVVFGFLCLAAGAPGLEDPSANLKGCLEFIQSSRFAAVSIADLSLITLILTKEVADDYKIRCAPENQERAGLIGASTALLPLLGTAIYCAARPSLPNSESD